MEYCVDFDDLCDNSAHTLDILYKVKVACPEFKVTLFTIPRRTSKVVIDCARSHDWIQLAPHGWRHTRGECLAWGEDEARDKIKRAADMGIDAPVFRAPAWLLDGDVYAACRTLRYTVASHHEYRIPDTGIHEYIYNEHKFAPHVRKIHGHLTPVTDNRIDDMLERGELNFPEGSTFYHPQDIACVF